MERLERLADGRLLYRFKRPWLDGTTHIVMEPLEMLEKLAALVPAPKVHLVRYSGLLAPAAKWRARIAPESGIKSPALRDTVGATQASSSVADPARVSVETSPGRASLQSAPHRHGRNYTWAELMKRVFEIDVLECPRCLGRMRILAAIHPPDATRKILECLGLPSRAPPVAPACKYPTQPEWF
jgi:hypothetical protein